MALLESGPEIAVFEGELVFDEGNEACEEFEKALEGLQRSGVRIPTVDLARVTAVSAKPADLLFTMWLDLIREGRAFVLLAPDHVWEMLGRAAVDRMLVKRPASASRLPHGVPSASKDMTLTVRPQVRT